MQKKNNIILFAMLFIITIIVFYPVLMGHYATDTYNIANVGYQKYAINWSLRDGRLFMYLITMIAEITKMNINVFVIGTLLLALIISVVSVMKLTNIIERYKNPINMLEKIIMLLISYITIFNFMYLENLYFVESFVMAISILLLIFAADNATDNTKIGFVKNIIYVILAVFCYQGTIGFYLALVFLLILIKNKKNIKYIVINLFGCIATIGIAIGLNIIFVKYICNFIGLQQTRISSFSSIFLNIKYIKNNFNIIMTDSVGLFPKYLQLILIFMVIINFIVYLIYTKDINIKNKLISFLLLIFVTILSGFSTYILSLTSFFTGRLRFSIGALLGIMFIYIYINSNIFKDPIFKYILISILYVYVLTTIIQYVIIINDSKRVNIQEKQDANEIAEYINNYQKENNISVEKIAIGIEKGKSNKTYYDNIKSKNILTYNALKCDWSVNGVIYFYSGIKLEKNYVTNINEMLQEDEEYKCIGNALYIKVYNY